MRTKLFAPLFLTLLACSTIKVTSDFDRQANFASYKTFAFTEDAKKLPILDINRDRILRAIETELGAKGITKSDNPDIWVDVNIKAQQKTEATATSSGGGYYGGPWRYGYGGGMSTTHINYNEYIEGTLFVNMVDKGTEKIVWQGRATKTIDEDASAEKRESNINYAVKQIFTKYPPK